MNSFNCPAKEEGNYLDLYSDFASDLAMFFYTLIPEESFLHMIFWLRWNWLRFRIFQKVNVTTISIPIWHWTFGVARSATVTLSHLTCNIDKINNELYLLLTHTDIVGVAAISYVSLGKRYATILISVRFCK